MSKFNVGDKVRRTSDFYGSMEPDTTYVVTSFDNEIGSLYLDGITDADGVKPGWDSDLFELVTEDVTATRKSRKKFFFAVVREGDNYVGLDTDVADENSLEDAEEMLAQLTRAVKVLKENAS